MKKKTREELLRQLDTLTCRAAVRVDRPTLKSNGQDITPALRDELLAKNAAGELVVLTFSARVYSQAPGEPNRNFVRFRDGAMRALGRSGRGMPFLKDHEQGDQLSRGGTITDSRTEDLGDAKFEIWQDFEISAQWAVDQLLRGLITTFSIGWQPTGPIMCSACNAPRYSVCYHWPGDRLKEWTDDEGVKRYKRDAAGSTVVEWVYSDAELVETSTVSVPAVLGTQIEGIRAALAALSTGDASYALSGYDNGGELPHEDDMNLFKALVPILALAATASEEEVLKAVKDKLGALEAAEAKLAIADKERVELAAEVAEYRAAKDKADEDKAIRDALGTGRIGLDEESLFRRLYKVDRTGFDAELAKRPAGYKTAVGLAAQRDKAQPVNANPPPAATELDAQVATALASDRVDAGKVIEAAAAFGAKTPLKSIAGAYGVKEA